MIEIFIPNWRPTRLNELVNAHYMAAAKKKKADRNMVFMHTRGLPVATTKRSVEIEIVLGYKWRKADVDAYHKSLCDALVASKMLVDDSDKWCELKPLKYSKDDSNPGTWIRLHEIA